MKKLLKIRTSAIIPLALAVMLIVSSAACSSLDVVQKDAVRAFGDVLGELPAWRNESVAGGWVLEAPDGNALFIFGEYFLGMEVEAAPFVAAGLKLSELENVGADSIIFSVPFESVLDGAADALGQFETDAGALRNYRGYHTALDHYKIDLGGGNMFDWAKDMPANDKDVVFVLNPEPLIAAGVDPNVIDGWTLAKVSVDIDGKATEVDKLLKAFDLK
jgi:hypothetical protein